MHILNVLLCKKSRKSFKQMLRGICLISILLIPNIVLAMPSLRVMTYNVRSFDGHPFEESVSGLSKAQRANLIADEIRLYAPDIVTFQEPDGDIEFFKTQLADRFAGVYEFGWIDCDDERPPWRAGAYLYRRDILNAPELDACIKGDPSKLFDHFGHLRFSHNDEVLNVYTFKLTPGRNGENQDKRLAQINILEREYLQDDILAGESVLVIGDLNHTPDVLEYQRWLQIGLIDTFAQKGRSQGFTKLDDDGLLPERRIDYILAAGPIAQRLLSSTQVNERRFAPRSNSLYFDNELWSLSDHLPMLATFSGNTKRPIPSGWVTLITKDDIGEGQRLVLRSPENNLDAERLRMDRMFWRSTTRNWKIENADSEGFVQIKNRNNESLFLRADPGEFDDVANQDAVVMDDTPRFRSRRWQFIENLSEEAGYYNIKNKKPVSYQGKDDTFLYLRASEQRNDSENYPPYMDTFSRTSDSRKWLIIPMD